MWWHGWGKDNPLPALATCSRQEGWPRVRRIGNQSCSSPAAAHRWAGPASRLGSTLVSTLFCWGGEQAQVSQPWGRVWKQGSWPWSFHMLPTAIGRLGLAPCLGKIVKLALVVWSWVSRIWRPEENWTHYLLQAADGRKLASWATQLPARPRTRATGWPTSIFSASLNCWNMWRERTYRCEAAGSLRHRTATG